MKIGFDVRKSAEAITKVAHASHDLVEKVSTAAKDSVQVAADKAKKDKLEKKRLKYNPLFPSDFFSGSFNVPNLIVMVDDAQRRGIDVCEGAIGWLSKEGEIEVLHLYDEAVASCGLTFVPAAACDAFYYIDSFDRTKFVQLESIFRRSHEERLAELKHIAYSLGAKRCIIDISEEISERTVNKKKAQAVEKYNGISADEKIEIDTESKNRSHQKGRIETVYDGSDNPVVPKLKWFAHDDNILQLIEARINNVNGVRNETLTLSGTSFSRISQKAAYDVDCAVHKIAKAKGKFSLDAQVEKEQRSSLIFHVEF